MNAYKWPRGIFVPILVVIAVMLIFTIGVVAAAPGGGVLDGKNPLGADDGILDVGAEYSSADAPPLGPGGGDLPYTVDSATHFYNKMRAAGYTGSQSFIYGNQLAWETDWKRAALGGSENSYIDNVDIVFFHDHGGTNSMWFPWGHTDTDLVPNDCAGSWGDKDVEWIGIKSCLTLSSAQPWASCMEGVHTIAGMTTISYGADYGGDWADQLLGWKMTLPFIGDIWLRAPKTITQAWFTACDANQPSSVRARVIAEHPDHFNDKVWNRGGPARGDDVDAWAHFIDHNCYKPEPRVVDTSILETLPAYEVIPRQVDQAYAASIAATLDMSGTLRLSPDGQEYAITDTEGGMTRTLSIQTATGGYVYQNLGQLWVPPPSGQPLSLPGTEEALALSNAFFLANQQALPGAQYRDLATQYAETERLTTSGKAGTAAAASGILQSEGIGVLVAYGRHLGTGVHTASGAAVDVSVVGPGSATKSYLGDQGVAGRGANAQQLPIGLVGGSRDVQAGARTITVQSADKAWDDFLADHQLAVVSIPVTADEIVRKPVSDTLAYYEQPQGVSQQEMIPVWAFRADFKNGGEVVLADALVYVPASPDYYPPEVVIEEPANGAIVRPGQSITFKATASGGFEPFTYQWIASNGSILGNEATISSGLIPSWHPGDAGVSEQTVSVQVTNANGQSRAENVTVNVLAPVYLPMLQRR